MFLPYCIRVDMGWIVFLVWIVKDKETIGNLDSFPRDAVSLANILDFFFIRSIARIGRHIICQWLTLVLFLLTSQHCLCSCDLLRREILLVEVMSMVSVSDHIALVILADDMICMESMIVLMGLFAFMMMITIGFMVLMVMLVMRILLLMVVVLIDWFCVWAWRLSWTLFFCDISTLCTG